MDKKKSTSSASSSTSSVSSSATTTKSKNSSVVSSSSTSGAAAASVGKTKTAKTIERNPALPRPVRRVLQNFLLVWLDANFNESNEDFKKSLQYLRKIVASITTFTDAQECIGFISAIKNEKVFMIVSSSLGRQIVPEIEVWPQLESVYVFCGNQAVHEQWVKKIPKVKGVHIQIESMCKSLQIDTD